MWRVLVFNLTKTIFIMFDNDLSSSWKFVNNTTFHQNMSGVILSPATHTWSRRNTHKFQKQYSFSHGGFKNKRNRTRPCKHYIFHSVYILLRHKVYMYTLFHTNAICDYKMKNNSWINVFDEFVWILLIHWPILHSRKIVIICWFLDISTNTFIAITLNGNFSEWKKIKYVMIMILTFLNEQ